MPGIISEINGRGIGAEVATTASFATFAATAATATTATSASFATTATSASFASTATSASFATTATLATTATSASTQTISTSALHYPVFVDADNASPAAEKLGTDANINFNPSTNRLDITGSLGVTAEIAGTASNVTVTDQSLNGELWYPTFAKFGGTALGQGPMAYTPSTDTLQTTAARASQVAVTNTTTGTGPYYLMFADGTTGNRTARVDSSTLTFNATTNILTTTASFATSAQTVNTVTSALNYEFYPTFVDADNGTAGPEIVYTDAGIRYNPSTNILTTTATTASTILANNFAAGTYSIPWMSQTSAGVATRLNGGTSLTYITSTGQLNNTGSVHIQQTGNSVGNGIRLRQQGTSNYWDIFNSGSTGFQIGLNFRYNGGANGGYLETGANVATIDFTGQHRSLSNTINITGSADLTGLIVIADGTYTNLNNNHLPQINEALPNVSLSSIERDKRVFGVISDKEDVNGERTYAVGSWVSTFEKSNVNDTRLIINSLGEGGMWVCNANGSLENGDYITTSNLQGLGMKQSDDVLHNYTVAKITEDCLFDSIRTIDFEYSGSAYKKQFVGVTYHCG
jgi:hypothetical protein